MSILQCEELFVSGRMYEKRCFEILCSFLTQQVY
jgi:hypothetical protein